MKLLRITNLYPAYLRQFYARRPRLARQPYDVQRAALEHDAYELGGFWRAALEPLGYEVREIARDARHLQHAWTRENERRRVALDSDRIAVEQVRRYRPDVLWYCHYTEPLLAAIRSAVPSIRLVLGGTGAALAPTYPWRHADLLISCAPEVVSLARERGHRAAVLPHGFAPSLLGRLEPSRHRYKASFVGQVLDRDGFHRNRARVLAEVHPAVDIRLFFPRGPHPVREAARRLLGRALTAGPPRVLARRARAGVYGIEMFQTLRDSDAVLNVEPDSAARFASSMRLYESTGVGSCLVTDDKERLADSFEPDREVVVYRNAAECVEKLRWLAEHPRDRAAIAEAGQRRTLRDHTYDDRARRLDEIVRGAL